MAANTTIYSQTDPWVKPPYHYKAFQSSPAYSIFTELDPTTHSNHLKLLAPSFSHAKVTGRESLLHDYCDKLIAEMRKRVELNEWIGLLAALRSFALDIVTDWTFGRPTNALGNGFESEMFEIFDIAAESVIYVRLNYPFLVNACFFFFGLLR